MPDTLKNAKSIEELKVGDSESRKGRRSRVGTDVKEGKNRLGGHRISRAFNPNMENRKANLTTGANRESHQMTVCKTSMTNTETGQGNF